MKRVWLTVAAVFLASGTLLFAQSPHRPLSPPGKASVEVGGHWVKSSAQSFAMGDEHYVGGKWIEILYSRPLLRGRKAFKGTGSNYGKSTVAEIPGAPRAAVWRAGANVSTQLKTEVPLVIGGKTVLPGTYTLFIDLKRPTEWIFIVSRLRASPTFKPTEKDAIYGAFGYTPAEDVVRAAMPVTTLPYTVDELTWQFLDMTNTGGRIAILWDKSMGSVPFTIGH